MKRVLLLHGKDAAPGGKWYPWLAQQMQERGIECCVPALPDAHEPVMGKWQQVITDFAPDEHSILVGHSRGGVALLRWLEQEQVQVGKVILVAANSGLLEDIAITSESNYGFYTSEGYDFKAIRECCSEFVVLHSLDDEWVPYSHGEKNASGLGARLLTFDGHGHFGRQTPTVPALLKEILLF